jgi:hypothetical protein
VRSNAIWPCFEVEVELEGRMIGGYEARASGMLLYAA